MALVRRFVSQALLGGGSRELSDDEWSALCRPVDESETNEAAISRIVLGAYALRAGGPELYGPAPTLDGSTSATAVPEAWSVELPASDPTEDGGWEPTGPAAGLLIPADFAESGTVAGSASPWVPVRPGEGPPLAVNAESTAVSEVTVMAWTLPSADPAGDEVPEPVSPVEPTRRQRREQRQSRWKALGRPHRTHAKARPSRLNDVKRQRMIVVSSWISNIGVIILLFVAWQLWGTSIAQHHTQSALESQFQGEIHHPAVKPQPGFTLIPASTRIPDPPDGAPMAHLQIPKISLDQIVVSGTNEGDLAKGPGHYLGTAMPGQAGNVAIAGHRTTHGAPFNRLAELAIGDPIYLTTASGQQLTYIVSAVPVAVSPKDVTVLNNFGDDRLTLTTCNPEYSAVQRLIVVAAYLPPGATHPVTIAKGTGKTYALAPAETSGWNTTLLPLVAVEVLALVGLGLTYRRLSKIYGKGTRWIILGPIWVALLIALFETLTNFLPAAV